MNSLIRSTTLALLMAAGLTLPLVAAEPPAGFVDFGRFAPPADGGQFIEVNVSAQLLSLAARLTEKQEPEIANLLRGLKSIRVNVIGLNDGNRKELGERLQLVRSELEGRGWERVVTVLEKKQDVGVYLKHRGDEAIEGVVVTVIENGKEAVFVNVVGDIQPEKLALIGERLNIEPLKKAAKAASKS